MLADSCQVYKPVSVVERRTFYDKNEHVIREIGNEKLVDEKPTSFEIEYEYTYNEKGLIEKVKYFVIDSSTGEKSVWFGPCMDYKYFP
jgi:hypothetical protein